MSSTGTPASDSTETNECRNSRGVHSFGSRGPGAAPFGSPAGRWLVRTHAQGLTDQVSQADRSSYLGLGGSTLDSHDMWIVRRELSRILDDNDPILLRHQRQQSGKQSRLAALVPPQSSTVCQHPHSHGGSQRARHSHTNWIAIRGAGHARSPRKFSPQRALNEPEARLGQHDEHGNPGDITDYRTSERMEYRDSRQDIPEIDRIRPLAQPPHWAACQQ